MEQNTDKDKSISRRKFMQTCGSIAAGGVLAVISGGLIKRRYSVFDETLDGGQGVNLRKDSFTSPYKLVASFSVPDRIDAFELAGDELVVATPNNIFIYDRKGSPVNNFSVGSNLRDIAVAGDDIYLLFPTRVEVCDRNGERLREWEACSELSDYCSLAVTPGGVFVTDAANKNICKYTAGGGFVKFINSPDRFIIPGCSFGITYTDGVIYCSNPGRHKVEKYSVEGDYLGSFGQPGGAAGMFGGCCNPVHLACTSAGEVITSEKGNPRISCYGTNGGFRSMLLDSEALGGGNAAYDIKVAGDKLFVAGKNMISTFRYDTILAAKTACSDCKVNCPLRKGITI